MFAQDWTLPEPAADTYSDELLNNAKEFSDNALIVFSRPGASQNLILSFNVEDMASYDMNGTGGSSCLINRDVTTNNVTDTDNPLTVQRMRQACKDILYTYTGINSRGHASENIDTGLMSWQIILIVADVILAAVAVFLEVKELKSYKKRKAEAEAEAAKTAENL